MTEGLVGTTEEACICYSGRSDQLYQVLSYGVLGSPLTFSMTACDGLLAIWDGSLVIKQRQREAASYCLIQSCCNCLLWFS